MFIFVSKLLRNLSFALLLAFGVPASAFAYMLTDEFVEVSADESNIPLWRYIIYDGTGDVWPWTWCDNWLSIKGLHGWMNADTCASQSLLLSGLPDTEQAAQTIPVGARILVPSFLVEAEEVLVRIETRTDDEERSAFVINFEALQEDVATLQDTVATNRGLIDGLASTQGQQGNDIARIDEAFRALIGEDGRLTAVERQLSLNTETLEDLNEAEILERVAALQATYDEVIASLGDLRNEIGETIGVNDALEELEAQVEEGLATVANTADEVVDEVIPEDPPGTATSWEAWFWDWLPYLLLGLLVLLLILLGIMLYRRRRRNRDHTSSATAGRIRDIHIPDDLLLKLNGLSIGGELVLNAIRVDGVWHTLRFTKKRSAYVYAEPIQQQTQDMLIKNVPANLRRAAARNRLGSLPRNEHGLAA